MIIIKFEKQTIFDFLALNFFQLSQFTRENSKLFQIVIRHQLIIDCWIEKLIFVDHCKRAHRFLKFNEFQSSSWSWIHERTLNIWSSINWLYASNVDTSYDRNKFKNIIKNHSIDERSKQQASWQQQFNHEAMWCNIQSNWRCLIKLRRSFSIYRYTTMSCCVKSISIYVNMYVEMSNEWKLIANKSTIEYNKFEKTILIEKIQKKQKFTSWIAIQCQRFFVQRSKSQYFVVN